MVTLQATKADEFSKIILIAVQENFDNTYRESIDCICHFFTNFSMIRGLTHPPDAINRFLNFSYIFAAVY